MLVSSMHSMVCGHPTKNDQHESDSVIFWVYLLTVTEHRGMTISEFIGKLYHRIILFRRVPHVDLNPCGLLQFKLLEANIWKRRRFERHVKMAFQNVDGSKHTISGGLFQDN